MHLPHALPAQDAACLRDTAAAMSIATLDGSGYESSVVVFCPRLPMLKTNRPPIWRVCVSCFFPVSFPRCHGANWSWKGRGASRELMFHRSTCDFLFGCGAFGVQTNKQIYIYLCMCIELLCFKQKQVKRTRWSGHVSKGGKFAQMEKCTIFSKTLFSKNKEKFGRERWEL